MKKLKGVFTRMSEGEKGHLTKLAKANGLSLSEYIRIKLLEENKDQAFQYKDEISRFGLIAYYTLGKIAKKQLSEKEIEEAKIMAEKVLKKWNTN